MSGQKSLLAFSLILLAAGCKKSAPLRTVPPPPPAAAEVKEPAPVSRPPTIGEFIAEPKTIDRGQKANLLWRVTDATEISIAPGVGVVASAGKREVSPKESTTYTLTAKGPGGIASAFLMVGVIFSSPPPIPKTGSSESLVDTIKDAYFDYDASDLRQDARIGLVSNASVLKELFSEWPSTAVLIEGHCDERGSAEYNLGLGDQRANTARDFLIQLQVPADRLKAISYGKERPQCADSREECWQRNRRVHFVVENH